MDVLDKTYAVVSEALRRARAERQRAGEAVTYRFRGHTRRNRRVVSDQGAGGRSAGPRPDRDLRGDGRRGRRLHERRGPAPRSTPTPSKRVDRRRHVRRRVPPSPTPSRSRRHSTARRPGSRAGTRSRARCGPPEGRGRPGEAAGTVAVMRSSRGRSNEALREEMHAIARLLRAGRGCVQRRLQVSNGMLQGVRREARARHADLENTIRRDGSRRPR